MKLSKHSLLEMIMFCYGFKLLVLTNLEKRTQYAFNLPKLQCCKYGKGYSVYAFTQFHESKERKRNTQVSRSILSNTNTSAGVS